MKKKQKVCTPKQAQEHLKALKGFFEAATRRADKYEFTVNSNDKEMSVELCGVADKCFQVSVDIDDYVLRHYFHDVNEIINAISTMDGMIAKHPLPARNNKKNKNA
jgi:hypothetical protein